MTAEGRYRTGDPCPVCAVGRIWQEPEQEFSCSNCMWNSEDDTPADASGQT